MDSSDWTTLQMLKRSSADQKEFIVDVRGTQTGNKGAQLMLEAIVERFSERFVLSAQTHLTDFDVRSTLGLRQTLHHYRAPRLSQAISDLIPRKARGPYGLVADSELSGVLDASGFAYSDQWGASRARTEALFGRRQAARGLPKVLLPQAFGPFENSDVRRWTKELLNQSSIVFARDRVSERHLRAFSPSTRIERSPDFTIGVSAIPVQLPITAEYFAVVPNARLVDRGGQTRKAYIAGLANLVAAAEAEGLSPLVVVHETQDLHLATELAEVTNSALYSSSHPRELKYVLGQASAVVTSRFHALVGSLSQGVPALTWGWSHKYVELLEDFGVPEWIVTAHEEDPGARVRSLVTDSTAKPRLEEAKPRLVEAIERMWRLTEEALLLGLRH